MKRHFKYLREDRLIFRIYILTVPLILLTFLYIAISYNKLPTLLPVFNQLPWGERRLGDSYTIFIPAIIVSIFFIVNCVISALSYTHSPLISRMLAITSFLTALLAFLFILRTIQLII